MPSLIHALTTDLVHNTITHIKQHEDHKNYHHILHNLLSLEYVLSNVDDIDHENITNILALYKAHTHYTKDYERSYQQRLQRAQKRSDHEQEIKLLFELSQDKKEKTYVEYPVPNTFKTKALQARKLYLINQFPYLYLSNHDRILTLQKYLTRDTTYDS